MNNPVIKAIDVENEFLELFRWSHQVQTPWGESTASFQVGAGGVQAIEPRPSGIWVFVVRADGQRWAICFSGSGYGWRKVGFHCEDCAENEFATEVELAAHRRSHKPNHKGDGK